MALIRNQFCRKCEQDTRHCNDKCTECAKREYRERVGAWNALTVDERLQDLRRRVEELEKGTPVYN